MVQEFLYTSAVIAFFSSFILAILSLKKYVINAVYNVFSKKQPYKIHPFMDKIRKTFLGGYITLCLILLIIAKNIFHYSNFFQTTKLGYLLYLSLFLYSMIGLFIVWYTNSRFGITHFKKGMIANKQDFMRRNRKLVNNSTYYVRNYGMPNHMEITNDKVLKEIYVESKLFTIDFIQFKDILLGVFLDKKSNLDFWSGKFYRNSGVSQIKFVNLIYDCFQIDFQSVKSNKKENKAIRDHIEKVINCFDVKVHKNYVKDVFDERSEISRQRPV